MDCAKAFDKMSHGLFLKLVNRNVPLCFIRVIMYWYLNMEAQVKWLNVTSGTRQGGVISPHFYGIYIEDLIVILRHRKIGCHLIGICIACILYADDSALMASLRSTMQ